MLVRLTQLFCVFVLIVSLAGCAVATKQNPDPYISYNRTMFQFNQGFNKVILSPLTAFYSDVTPGFVRTGVANFFNNVDTIPDIVNDLLQFNFRYLLRDTTRFLLNSTLGLFGLVDVATNAGLPPHQQSFGLTLYKWGLMRHSPYFVLPFLGPSTVRNALGVVPDYFMNPISYVRPLYYRYGLKGIELLQKATSTLPQLNFITRDALDPYVALRSAYLQNQELVVKQIMSDGEFDGETAEPLKPPVTFTEPPAPQGYLSEKTKAKYDHPWSKTAGKSQRPAQPETSEAGEGAMSPLMQEMMKEKSQPAQQPAPAADQNSEAGEVSPALKQATQPN